MNFMLFCLAVIYLVFSFCYEKYDKARAKRVEYEQNREKYDCYRKFKDTYLKMPDLLDELEQNKEMYDYVKEHYKLLVSFERPMIMSERDWIRTSLFNAIGLWTARKGYASKGTFMTGIGISSERDFVVAKLYDDILYKQGAPRMRYYEYDSETKKKPTIPTEFIDCRAIDLKDAVWTGKKAGVYWPKVTSNLYGGTNSLRYCIITKDINEDFRIVDRLQYFIRKFDAE